MTDTKPDLEMNTARAKAFSRDQNLEAVLMELNGAMLDTLPPPYRKPKYPVIFIMGCPRSGSTLTLQWLANLGLFTYPSNLIARFYGNPYMAGRIQQALVDYDTRNQIGLHKQENYSSALGRTMGALAPSEYWYYWRQFFHFGEIQQLTNTELTAVDTTKFVEGIAGLEAAFDKPVIMKGMILDWHIPFLDSLFEKTIFINVERDDFFTAQSLYHAREKFFGDVHKWYSFKPPEYDQLKALSVYEQLAGQVYYTKNAVRDGLSNITSNRIINIAYEEFCQTPERLISKIAACSKQYDYHFPDTAIINTRQFHSTNTESLPQNRVKELRKAVQMYNNVK